MKHAWQILQRHLYLFGLMVFAATALPAVSPSLSANTIVNDKWPTDKLQHLQHSRDIVQKAGRQGGAHVKVRTFEENANASDPVSNTTAQGNNLDFERIFDSAWIYITSHVHGAVARRLLVYLVSVWDHHDHLNPASDYRDTAFRIIAADVFDSQLCVYSAFGLRPPDFRIEAGTSGDIGTHQLWEPSYISSMTFSEAYQVVRSHGYPWTIRMVHLFKPAYDPFSRPGAVATEVMWFFRPSANQPGVGAASAIVVGTRSRRIQYFPHLRLGDPVTLSSNSTANYAHTRQILAKANGPSP